MTFGRADGKREEFTFSKEVSNHAGSDQHDILDEAAEKRLVRKIDWHLIPILWILCVVGFVDRINIGNARIQGLEKELHMKGSDFNIALFMFFIPYILFEVPSNILMKKLSPPRVLSCLVMGIGIVTVGQGVTRSFAGLVICRVLMGCFEAGFFPGCLYLMSMYYKRHELQLRFNIFWCAGIISGAFSGLLAYAIAHMNGVAGYSGWRWIFIVEGLVTVVVAASAWFLIPEWPESVKFLSQEERTLLEQRLRRDTMGVRMDRLDKQAAKRVFGDIKIWLGVLSCLGIVCVGYSTAFFAPTILKQLGYTSLGAQIMSIPVYVCACVFAVVAALLSDRFQHRYGFIMAGCLIATVGYAILLDMYSVPVGARYFALFAISVGGFMTQPMVLVFLNNNLAGHYKRGIGAAMQLGLGNLGGIVASNIFVADQAPTYRVGFGVGLALVWVCAVSTTLLLLYLKRENRKRSEGARDEWYARLPEHEKTNLGDAHPSFRFTY